MAHRKMITTGPMRYGTRMLQAGDDVVMSGPQARLYEAMGKVEEAKRARRAMRPQLDHDGNGQEGGSKSPAEDLTALRAEYREKLGKNPFNGWDADTLRAKIAAA